jgi:peptidoglycan/xylan/chitin deacetylase (PgdA/CDA1 family)
VLTFHGVQEDTPDPQVLDHSLHVPLSLFKATCEHLKERYNVISMADVVAYQTGQKKLPKRAVAITFDDGYASNYHLAWPVLKRYGLSSTIYLTSGFLDGIMRPWFVRLEHSLAITTEEELSVHGRHWPLATWQQRSAAYLALTGIYKSLPNPEAEALIAEIAAKLKCISPELPAPLKPMTWDQAREMQSGGLVEFGGHTHSHPILARCKDDAANVEIQHSMDCLVAELDQHPRTFAYPNGQPGDYTVFHEKSLLKAGFTAGFNMTAGFVSPQHSRYDLYRYGNPRSVDELESVVSGSMAFYSKCKAFFGLGRSHG